MRVTQGTGKQPLAITERAEWQDSNPEDVPVLVPVLIAEVERLTEEAERLRAQNDGLYQATLMLSAEVNRLWAWIEFAGEHQPTEDDFTEAVEWERQRRQARA